MEKNIKIIFEMCFIFLVPLILLCVNLNIHKDYVYDSSGNFESSDFSFDLDNLNFISSSNPIIQIQELFEDNIGIDKTNSIIVFINYYNALWVLMFLIWHLVYIVFDGIVHILHCVGRHKHG